MAAADVSCVIPAASDERFLAELVDVCVKYRVSLLFSLHDWEAPFIAANLEKFRAVGTIPVVSNLSVIGLCLDKLLTQEFAHCHGIAYPFTVSSPQEASRAVRAGNLKAPVVVKPRFGQGSVGLQTVWDDADFDIIRKLLMKRMECVDSNQVLTVMGRDSLVFQELSRREFGLDVVNDLKVRCLLREAQACYARRNGCCRDG
jgi:carbamoyl-phosphate synthase large subunit